MGRDVFIVSRERPELFEYLTQTFSDAETVEVIWDRRCGERRRAAGPTAMDRRRSDRRARPRIDADLHATGYAFLSLA